MPKRTDVRQRLAEGPPILADGAMGTMLMAHGYRIGESPERDNLDRPDAVRAVTAAYVEAGAELCQTNTFGASPLRLAPWDLDDETEAINRAAVDIAREAAGDRALVAGTCGPCGLLLEPHGIADPDVVHNGFVRQFRALIEAGIDAVLIETMMDLAEAQLAIRAARSVSDEIPIVATMIFRRDPGGYATPSGITTDQAARGLEHAGADVIGCNCGSGVAASIEIARELRDRTTLPLAVQPSAGLPFSHNGGFAYPDTPDDMAALIPELIDLGVRIIGACCGSTPAHIAALRRAIDVHG
jgi:5-methyltetrahydrofolate--homocysteine methyltransferase